MYLGRKTTFFSPLFIYADIIMSSPLSKVIMKNSDLGVCNTLRLLHWVLQNRLSVTARNTLSTSGLFKNDILGQE